MKKLLLGALVMLIFSLSLLIVQTSCSKSEAQGSSATNQLNKLIFYTSNRKFWMCNYDGSNVTQINPAIPSGNRIQMNGSSFSFLMSPDGQKVFFTETDASGKLIISSTNISGSGYTQIIASTPQLLEPVIIGVY